MNLKQVWRAMEEQARLNAISSIASFNDGELENPKEVEFMFEKFRNDAFDTFKECFEEHILKDMFDGSQYLDDDLPDAEDKFMNELKIDYFKGE